MSSDFRRAVMSLEVLPEVRVTTVFSPSMALPRTVAEVVRLELPGLT